MQYRGRFSNLLTTLALTLFLAGCGGGGGGGTGGTTPPVCKPYENLVDGSCQERDVSKTECDNIVVSNLTGCTDQRFTGYVTIIPDDNPPNTGKKLPVDGICTKDRTGVPNRRDIYYFCGSLTNDGTNDDRSLGGSINSDDGNPSKWIGTDKTKYTPIVSDVTSQMTQYFARFVKSVPTYHLGALYTKEACADNNIESFVVDNIKYCKDNRFLKN